MKKRQGSTPRRGGNDGICILSLDRKREATIVPPSGREGDREAVEGARRATTEWNTVGRGRNLTESRCVSAPGIQTPYSRRLLPPGPPKIARFLGWGISEGG